MPGRFLKQTEQSWFTSLVCVTGSFVWLPHLFISACSWLFFFFWWLLASYLAVFDVHVLVTIVVHFILSHKKRKVFLAQWTALYSSPVPW